MATTLYLDFTSPSGFTKPSGYLGTWADTKSGGLGTGTGGLSATAGTGSGSNFVTGTAVTAATSTAFVQCFSATLTAQTIAAGTWTCGVGFTYFASSTDECRLFIGVMKGDGTGLRGTILSTTNLGGGKNYNGTYMTAYSAALSGAAVTAQDGDVLIIEMGVTASIGGANAALWANGTTAITSDGAVNSTAKSFITCPTTLTFLTPADISVSAAATGSASLSLSPVAPLAVTAAATAAASVSLTAFRTGQVITAQAQAAASVGIVAVNTNPPGPPMKIYATKIYLSVGDGLVQSGAEWVPESGDYLDLMDGQRYLVLENGLEVPDVQTNTGSSVAGAVPRIRSARSLPNREITLKLIIKGTKQPNSVTATQDSTDSIWASWRAVEYKLEQARAASGPIGHGTNVVLMVRFPLSTTQTAAPAFSFFDVLDGSITPVDGTNTGTYYQVTLKLSCLPYTRQKAVTWPAGNAYTGPLTNDESSQVYLGPAVNGYLTDTVYFTPGGPGAAYLGSTLLTGVPSYGTFDLDDSAATYGTVWDSFSQSAGASQAGESVALTGWSGTKTVRLGQYATSLLSAGVIPAGSWTFGFAAAVTSTGATWQPVVAITQWNAASSSHTLILDTTVLGAGGRTAGGAEVTAYGTVSVPAVTLAAGDQLVIETGVRIVGAGNAVAAAFYAGGGTAITTDNASATQAASFMKLSGKVTFGYVDSLVSGPIAGDAGAMAQIHVLDQSTAGAINRLRIGRRSVPGARGGAGNGGIQPGDWVGVVNADAAIGSATLHTGQTNAVDGDYCSLLLPDANNWHDIARMTSEVNGQTPLYEQGIYDVWVRVRDSAASQTEPAITSLTESTLAAGKVLIPDQYTVRVAAVSGSDNSDASPPESLTLGYTNWPPNLFYESFEAGNSDLWITLNNSSASGGNATVTTEASLVGQYGFLSTLFSILPNVQSATTYVAPSQQQIARGFTPLTADPIQLGFWCRITSVAHSGGAVVLASLASSSLWYNNPPTTTYGGSTASTTGDLLGNIASIVLIGSQFWLRVWTTGGRSDVPLLAIPAGNILNQPLWCTIHLSVPYIDSIGSCTVTATIQGAGINATASSASTIPSAISANQQYADTVMLGALITDFSGAATVLYDDITLHQSSSATFPTPNQGIVVASDDGTNTRTVYFQQGNGAWMAVPNLAQATVAGADQIFGSGTGSVNPLFENPASANPQPCQIRGRLSVSGATANPIYTPAVDTLIQNSQWHMVNLGTIPLPPISTMEGLNPAGGSGNGGFAWQLDIQGLSPNSGATGSNTLDIDAVWLFPHDEPQIVAEYNGMNNTTPVEWVVDTRRDGRSGALLRNASDHTTQVGSANTIGFVRLAPGNQDLLILAERDGGVHDVANTKFSVQVRYQPQNHFLGDTSTVY